MWRCCLLLFRHTYNNVCGDIIHAGGIRGAERYGAPSCHLACREGTNDCRVGPRETRQPRGVHEGRPSRCRGPARPPRANRSPITPRATPPARSSRRRSLTARSPPAKSRPGCSAATAFRWPTVPPTPKPSNRFSSNSVGKDPPRRSKAFLPRSRGWPSKAGPPA